MKIRVKNYQRHKDSQLEVNPGVTALVGKSDHGKSSIVRAINWFCFDRPRGNAFVRKGTSSVEVSIDNIAHKKDKSKNWYEIDGELVETNKATASINISEVNIQRQHDTPFLLDASAGEVARKLSDLIDLTRPQTILKNLKKKGTSLQNKRISLLELKESYNQELNKYVGLVKYKRRLAVFESKRLEIEKNKTALVTLQAALNNATGALLRVQAIPKTEGLQATVAALLQRVTDAEKVLSNLRNLERAVSVATEKANNRIESVKPLISSCKEIMDNAYTLSSRKENLDNISATLIRLRKLNVCLLKYKQNSDLKNVTEKYLEEIILNKKIEQVCSAGVLATMAAADIKDEIEEKLKEINNLKKELKICPLCGSEFHGID